MTQIEHTVLKNCLKGERKAQMQFYSLFYKRIYNSCFRILRDACEAEDAMQESFMKAFSKLDQYNETIPLEAWITRISINTSIDKLRKQEPEFMQIQENLDYPASNDSELEDWEWIVEQAAQIKDMINQLSDKYRLVVTLYLIEGFDFEEIAEILKMKPVTVRVRFMRGKEKLKTLLQAN